MPHNFDDEDDWHFDDAADVQVQSAGLSAFSDEERFEDVADQVAAWGPPCEHEDDVTAHQAVLNPEVLNAQWHRHPSGSPRRPSPVSSRRSTAERGQLDWLLPPPSIQCCPNYQPKPAIADWSELTPVALCLFFSSVVFLVVVGQRDP